jgi:hypothetical protein
MAALIRREQLPATEYDHGSPDWPEGHFSFSLTSPLGEGKIRPINVTL